MAERRHSAIEPRHTRAALWIVLALVLIGAVLLAVGAVLWLRGLDDRRPLAAEPSLSPTPAAATPAASPEVLPPPSPDPTSASTDVPERADLGPGSFARVAVNGLAVRRGPGTSQPMVASYRHDAATNTEVLVSDSVRLEEGRHLLIEHGPLVVDAVGWYLVHSIPASATELPARWDADGDELHHDPGWVAGGQAGTAYLVASDAPLSDGEHAHGPGPEPYALMSGIGDARSDRFVLDAPIGVDWIAAALDGEGCSMVVTLQPAGVEMGSRTIDGWSHHESWWPEGGPLPGGDQHLEIVTDCSWSLRAQPIQG